MPSTHPLPTGYENKDPTKSPIVKQITDEMRKDYVATGTDSFDPVAYLEPMRVAVFEMSCWLVAPRPL